ncbi:MAG: hypothetical protein HY961_05995 [Ignavibacteriae bacterium]|nr:hypothetical protein [Ignavibacteriota bacterium]
MRAVLYKYNPAIPRRWLLIVAGLLWTSVGTMLCLRAIGWLDVLHDDMAPLFALCGFLIAIVAHRFMLTKAARRNANRISSLPERACMFAFTTWRGYLMIGGMVALGLLLRNSSFPREYLAVLYSAMGGALVLSSFVFYYTYWSLTRT